MTHRPLIHDQTLAEIQRYVEERGEPSYRAIQLWEGLYQGLVESADEISNLPMEFRQILKGSFQFNPFQIRGELRSGDGSTRKFLLETSGGAAIEVVLMSYDRRRTVCISTQVGCGMGCVFCATGQMGLERNLSSGEIIAQVLFVQRVLSLDDERLTNVVVMGMGEPFHNYEATMAAIRTLNNPHGLNFGARRFTVSTVGLVPMIDRFIEEDLQVNLAVSLHAATQELRDQLLPVNARYPLDELMHACRRYVNITGRRLTFEWALIDGVNDSVEQANHLSDLIDGLNCHVNLIPLNQTSGYGGAQTRPHVIDRFLEVLHANGVSATVRIRRGIDIQAGCGQLATQLSNA